MNLHDSAVCHFQLCKTGKHKKANMERRKKYRPKQSYENFDGGSNILKGQTIDNDVWDMQSFHQEAKNAFVIRIQNARSAIQRTDRARWTVSSARWYKIIVCLLPPA